MWFLESSFICTYQHLWVIFHPKGLSVIKKNEHPLCVFTVTSPIFHSAHLWYAYTISLCSVPAQAIVAPLSILFPWEAVWNCWPLPSPLQPRRRLRPWNYGNGIRRRSPWLIDEQSRASHAGSGDGTDVHAVLGVTHHHGMWKPGGTRNHWSPVKISGEKCHTLLHKQRLLINPGKTSSTNKKIKTKPDAISYPWLCFTSVPQWFNTSIFSYQLTSCQGNK